MVNKSDKNCSIYFQNNGTPLIVQPKLIRSLGGGQVDYSYLYANKVYIIEAKSSDKISRNQIFRLKNTAKILSEIFQTNAELKLYVDRNVQVLKIY